MLTHGCPICRPGPQATHLKLLLDGSLLLQRSVILLQLLVVELASHCSSLLLGRMLLLLLQGVCLELQVCVGEGVRVCMHPHAVPVPQAMEGLLLLLRLRLLLGLGPEAQALHEGRHGLAGQVFSCPQVEPLAQAEVAPAQGRHVVVVGLMQGSRHVAQ